MDPEDKQLLQDIRQLIVTQGVGGPRPSPTPATLGRQAVKELQDYGGIHNVSEYIAASPSSSSSSSCTEPASPSAVTDDNLPFLGDADMKDLQHKKFANESELIKWFEPHFTALMTWASHQLKHKMIILNTERHPWVMDPNLGEPSKPDGVGLPVEMANFYMTPGDHKYANHGDTKFGVLAHWDLRDSIEFISEWKEGNHALFGALGEAIEYARRINSNFKSDCNVQETKRAVDMLVANQAGFQLARCVNGTVRALVYGQWNSIGSKQAFERFVLGTLWEKVPRQRPWLEALDLLTKNLGIELVETGTNSDCFLGRGASGRVFRVKRKDDNRELALKVALGTDGMARLAQENLQMYTHAAALQYGGVTATLEGYKAYPRRKCGALLTSPVGVRIKPLKKHVRAALQSLKRLSQTGFGHGDARWPNAIIIDDPELKCVWIDLRTLEEHAGEEDQIEAFVEDVTEFYNSFLRGSAANHDLELPIRDYLVDDSALSPLLDAMQSIWN